MHQLKATIKRYLSKHPGIKKALLKVLFRRRPYDMRVRRLFWLLTILPRYIHRGISLRTRLDLVPFNQFRIGNFSKLEKDVLVNNGIGDVIVEDEVQVGVGSVIIGPVKIGKHCGLSQYVRLLGMHHGIDPVAPHHHLPCEEAPIELGEDVFIGTGTVVMGKKNGEPLRLGDYCRIGANSVVMDDIPPYTIAVGNPAKVVKEWDFAKNEWVKVKSGSNKVNQASTFMAPLRQA